MCIEESGDGYKLDTNMSAEYMNIFDSRINNLNNAKNDLKKLIDSMIAPSQVNAANNAFSISSNIIPGGVTGEDIINGNDVERLIDNGLLISAELALEAMMLKNKEKTYESLDYIKQNINKSKEDIDYIFANSWWLNKFEF